jgi:hypothetical protein
MKRSWLLPRRRFNRWQLLNPWAMLIANADDGLYGDDKWRAGRAKTIKLALAWWFRNPAHNLTWYGLGVADFKRVVVGPWGDDQDRTDSGQQGFLWSVTFIEPWGLLLPIPLPYVNYTKGRWKAYAGWRPSGAFGFKLNIKRQG